MRYKVCITCLCLLLLVGCGKNDKSERGSESTQNVESTTEATVTDSPAENASDDNEKMYDDYANEATTDSAERDGMNKTYRRHNYEKFFTQDKYKEFINTNVSKWKDAKGEYCYPTDYESVYMLKPDILASQQFPEALLSEITTEELLDLIGKKAPILSSYDHVLDGLTGFRSDYNFVDELMSRKDCQKVVEKYYKSYTKKQREQYSRLSWEKYSNESGYDVEGSQRFQFVEALGWYFMKQDGKQLPDESLYALNE